MALVPLERAHGGDTPVLTLVSPTPVTALSRPEVDTQLSIRSLMNSCLAMKRGMTSTRSPLAGVGVTSDADTNDAREAPDHG